MADTEAVVRIVGDASAVAPAVAVAKGEVSGLDASIAELSAQMSAMAVQMSQSMGATAAATAEVATEMKVLIAETEAESLSLKSVAMSAREGAEAIEGMKAAVFGFAEVFMAAFAVEQISEWAKEFGEASEKVQHLSETFGVTTAQIQGFKVLADTTGISVDTITKGLGILDKNLVTSGASGKGVGAIFQQMGITAADAGDQMGLLIKVADKFADMADGPAKVAMAMQLFGKSGKDLIPILNEGSKGLEELRAKAVEYGAAFTPMADSAQKKGMELADSIDESAVAWQGVTNMLGDAFGPVLKDITDSLNKMIKAVIESYTEGGTAKIIFEAITGSMQILGTVIQTVATVLQPLGDVIGFVSTNINTILPIAAGLAVLLAGPYVVAATSALVSTILMSDAMFALGGAFALDGVIGVVSLAFDVFTTSIAAATVATIEFTIALLANPLTWIAVACAVAVGGLIWLIEHVNSASDAFDFLKDGVKIAMTAIGLAIDVTGIQLMTFGKIAWDAFTLNWSAIKSDWDAGLTAVVARVKVATDQIKALAADAQSHLSFGGGDKPAETPVPKPTPGFDPDLKTGKDKKPKDDLVQNLDEALKAKQVAWAMEQDAQGTAQEYSLQSVADYWKAALGLDNLSTKDKLAIEEKYLAAHQQLTQQDIAHELDSYTQKLSAAKNNAAERLAILNDEADRIGFIYGLDSKQYQAAQDAIVKAKQQAAAQIRQVDEIGSQAVEKANLDAIAADEALAKQQVAMGVTTNAQLLAQQTQFENQRYQIQLQAALRTKASAVSSDDPVKLAQINAQLEALERSHQAKLTQIDQQATLQRTQIERTAINATASLWGQNVAKLLTLQQGFATTVQSLYTGMVSIISNALASVIEKWIEQQISAFLFKRTAQAADGLASVTSNAAVAGAAAFASTAAIPIIGPELAPAAAAAAFAGAMTFAPLASAAGGFWQVPSDQLAQIHTDEMVLPSWAAGPLRSIIGGGAANSNAPAAANQGGGGDTHYHNYNIQALDGPSVKRILMDNAKHVATAGKAGVRQGVAAQR